MTQRTLYTMFLETVELHGDRPAVRFKLDAKGDYLSYAYREYRERIERFARGLDALGLKKGDRIAVSSHENRVEWAMTDLAAQFLGLITVPIYGTLPAAQFGYYLKDSGAKAIVISDKKLLAKVREFRGEAIELQFVVQMDGELTPLEGERLYGFEEVCLCGEKEGRDLSELQRINSSILPDSTATLIYTSGTTGDPKGTMMSHLAILETPDAVMAEPIVNIGDQDEFLSFLPLSHITERVAGFYLPLRAGSCITYSMGLSAFAKELTTTVRPTLILCVPRLWEYMYEKFNEQLPKIPENQRKIMLWAIEIGKKAALKRSEGKPTGLFLKIQLAIAERLALAKVREKTTGGRLRYCVSGGAPLDLNIAGFFLGIGIEILEGYGLSETNMIAVNRPGKQKIGTVGPLIDGAKVRIADDGEILMRGAGLMSGYWNKPEATAEGIDKEGWFHTGDVGELSNDGFLKITDRKKDLIVLTNGKKVAPQPIEALLKHSPYIAEAVLFGDKQPTVSALFVPAFDKLKAWASSQNLVAENDTALAGLPEVQKLFREEMDRHAPDLADFERIKRFKIIDTPFSIETGELTPSLKVKRKFVLNKYSEAVAAISKA